jgi:ribosomal protein S18 acetylase RimI-like enzyme
MLQTNNLHFKELFGIVMICVDPQYRGKGLAKKIIEKHFQDNSNKVVCLNTRKSNIGAFMLYKSMGYEHVAYIRNKYFLPTEDSVFMIKDLTIKEINSD